MSLNAFENLHGQTINDLHIYSILQRGKDGLPLYQCKCLRCGTRGVIVPHSKFRQGNAKCTASICKPVRSDARATVNPLQARRSAIREELDNPKPKQPPANPEADRRRAEQLQAERQESERLRKQWARYAAHMAKYADNLETTISLERWPCFGEDVREKIMAIVDRAKMAEGGELNK